MGGRARVAEEAKKTFWIKDVGKSSTQNIYSIGSHLPDRFANYDRQGLIVCSQCSTPAYVFVCMCVWAKERFFSICWCQAFTDMREALSTSPHPRVSLTLSLSSLSLLLSLFLLQASIPLSTPSGLCYLITQPLYQITEEEHKLTHSVREREREENGAVFRAAPDRRNVFV